MEISSNTADRIADALWDIWRIWRSQTRGTVTAEQDWILRRLARHGPAPVSRLAEARGVSVVAMTIATQRMEGNGWVTRHRLPDNQRVVEVALSDTGLALYQDRQKTRRESLIHMASRLSSEEQAQLAALLEKMRQEGADVGH